MELQLDRRAQILQAALYLFAERGIDGTGLRDIAQNVGITQPSLYHYFSSKEELVKGLIEQYTASIVSRQETVMEAAAETLNLRQGVHRMAEMLLRAFDVPEMRAFHRLMMGEMARGGPTAQIFQDHFLSQRRARVRQMFTALIAAGKVRDLDPDLLAVQLIGPIVFSGTLRNVDPSMTSERMRELAFQHIETLIRGIERT